jgi:hydrogenase maturation protease
LPQTSRNIGIVGLGNPLSGDDAFGIQVIERLRRDQAGLPPGAMLVDAHTDLLNRIEDFSEYARVLLVDAVLDPEGKLGLPGTVIVVDEERFGAFPETAESVHQMSPLLAVKLFRTLHPEAQTKITLIGLLVDRLSFRQCYADADRIEEAAAIIKEIA